MSCDTHGLGTAVCATSSGGITVAAVSTATDVDSHTIFVGTFNALPRPLVRRFGWHLMAFCRK